MAIPYVPSLQIRKARLFHIGKTPLFLPSNEIERKNLSRNSRVFNPACRLMHAEGHPEIESRSLSWVEWEKKTARFEITSVGWSGRKGGREGERAPCSVRERRVDSRRKRRRWSFILSRLNAIVRELITELGHRTPRLAWPCLCLCPSGWISCARTGSLESLSGMERDRRGYQALASDHEMDSHRRNLSHAHYRHR